MENIMAPPLRRDARRRVLRLAPVAAAIFVVGFAVPAHAQQPPAALQARIVVIGEGSATATPDYAEISSGVTTRGKTAKEAADANAKAMVAVAAALSSSAIEQKDIQTSRFSVQPVYASPQPGTEQRLTGFSVSNQIRVKIRQIGKVGDILDRLIESGATDVGSVEFLHADTAKLFDQAREAAIADARHKADLYAHAAGQNLGSVAWITEDSGYAPPMPMPMMRAAAAPGMPMPISAGEDTLRVRITVGFDFAH
jgi:uncharacterized protein YggE